MLYENERFIRYIERQVQNAISEYPMIAGPSSMTLGDAHITVIDLEDVLQSGSAGLGGVSRNNSLMYMLALRATAWRFFRNMEEISSEIELPFYRDYHIEQVKKLLVAHKELTIDEYHCTKTETAANQSDSFSPIDSLVEYIMRTGRKFNLRVTLSSQRVKDFTPAIRELSSNRFILTNPSTGEEADYLQNLFQYSNDVRRSLERYGKETGTFLLISETKKTTLYLMLKSPMSPMMLWAFNSVREDSILRDKLIEILGYEKAILTLAKLWPNCSIKEEYEALIHCKKTKESKDKSEIDFGIINSLVQKAVSFSAQIEENK